VACGEDRLSSFVIAFTVSRTVQRPFWGAFPACGVPPSRKPCRGDQHSKAGGSPRSCERSDGCRCSLAPTRTSYPLLCPACGIGWVKLEVERRRLDGLLFLASQSGKAVAEGIGDPKFHALLPRRGYRRKSIALLAICAALSFRSAFRRSGSSSSQGQPLIAACRGGGSSASTSRRTALTSPALTIAAPAGRRCALSLGPDPRAVILPGLSAPSGYEAGQQHRVQRHHRSGQLT